jgi:hypothetical protein
VVSNVYWPNVLFIHCAESQKRPSTTLQLYVLVLIHTGKSNARATALGLEKLHTILIYEIHGTDEMDNT